MPTYSLELHCLAASGKRRRATGEGNDSHDELSLDTNCWNRGSTDDHKDTRHGDERPGRRTMLTSLISLDSTCEQRLHDSFIVLAPEQLLPMTLTHDQHEPLMTWLAWNVSHSLTCMNRSSPSLPRTMPCAFVCLTPLQLTCLHTHAHNAHITRTHKTRLLLTFTP